LVDQPDTHGTKGTKTSIMGKLARAAFVVSFFLVVLELEG